MDSELGWKNTGDRISSQELVESILIRDKEVLNRETAVVMKKRERI